MALATHTTPLRSTARAEPWSPRFSTTARAVAAACRASGLVVPGFRSPPAVAGVDRTLRRWPDGRCVVAVRAAGRREDEVVADLIEGVIAANGLRGASAAEARSMLGRLLAGPEEVMPEAG